MKIHWQGANARAIKTMTLFLQGPCQGAAVLVETAAEADVFMLDTDTPSQSSQPAMDYGDEQSGKPTIVQSLWDVEEAHDVFFLKKPVDADSMLAVLKRVNSCLEARKRKDLLLERLSSQGLTEKNVQPMAAANPAVPGVSAKPEQAQRTRNSRRTDKFGNQKQAIPEQADFKLPELEDDVDLSIGEAREHQLPNDDPVGTEQHGEYYEMLSRETTDEEIVAVYQRLKKKKALQQQELKPLETKSEPHPDQANNDVLQTESSTLEDVDDWFDFGQE